MISGKGGFTRRAFLSLGAKEGEKDRREGERKERNELKSREREREQRTGSKTDKRGTGIS